MQYVANGIVSGAVYGLVALGFVIIFKATTVINFAQGAFMVLGAYLAGTLYNSGVPILVVFVAIPLVMGLMGFLVYHSLMRWLIGQAFFAVVLVTVGIEIVIRAGILIWYGPLSRGRLGALPSGIVSIGDTRITYANVIVVAAALMVAACILVFFKTTRLGLHMRGTAEHLEAAVAMGVNPHRVYAAAWAIGLGVAGVAGVLYANYAPSLELSATAIGLRAVPAAILGGIDSPGGAVLGGITIGVVESLVAGSFGVEYRDATAFGIMLIVILVRPTGFFGSRQLVRV